MFGIHDLPLFITAALLLNLTPGADMLYVISRSAGQGARAGCLAALGIAVGCLIHTVLAAVGLSAILATSATAFAILKYAGAAYLIYLGVLALRDAASGPRARPVLAASRRGSRVFFDGVVVNALNPKVGLFFLAFLPQFVAVGEPGSLSGLLILGLLFNAGGTLVNVLVAVFSSTISSLLHGSALAARALKTVLGSVLVILGLRLALSERV